MIERRFEELAPGELGPTVVTIGNFDGVHRGHQEILARLRELAVQTGLPGVAITFEPHPIKVLYPEKGLHLIVPFAERARLLAAAGVDVLVTTEFTRELAATPAEAWVCATLVDSLRAQRLLVGYDFSFGRGRDGNAAHLKTLGRQYGFEVEQMPAIIEDGRPVSSSRIRRLIVAGEIASANRLLGRPFHLSGRVEHGEGRGIELGFPTANLDTEWETVPHIGVYAAVAVADDEAYAAAVNVGLSPTFGLNRLRIEAYLLDYDDDLYGKDIALHFVRRLRDEKRFDSVERLLAEMTHDVRRVRETFAEMPPAMWIQT